MKCFKGEFNFLEFNRDREPWKDCGSSTFSVGRIPQFNISLVGLLSAEYVLETSKRGVNQIQDYDTKASRNKEREKTK